MILMASGRTDIPAFYSKWFMNRYEEGFIDVRNPFNPKLISRIDFKDVDLIMFCTKNPIPIIKYLDIIKKPILFHITLTPYKSDVEPNVPPKGEIINAIKKISNILGKEYISVRYDPIFVSDVYSLDYHLKAFENMCRLLSGYVNNIIVSFLDDYKNVRKNINYLRCLPFTEEIYKKVGYGFSNSAKKYAMSVQTCFEFRDLTEYGFIKGECLSKEFAYILTGKKFREQNIRKGKLCHCVQMVDIGAYNTCMHLCKYCYANFDEGKVRDNLKNHDDNSSLLIGQLEEGDIIKKRKK